jgi:hypothetical protein
MEDLLYRKWAFVDKRKRGVNMPILITDTSRNHAEEELVDVGTGSTRSKVDERYDLISPIGLRRLAGRYALGAKSTVIETGRKGNRLVSFVTI